MTLEWPSWLQDERLRLVLLLAATFLLGALFSWAAMLRLRRFFGVWRSRRGLKAERRARRLLKRAGYRIVEERPRYRHWLMVDGQRQDFEITPDFLVERGDRRYVVEVKRRGDGGDVANAGIRRQVLEYLVAGDLPCLLVRMPAGRIQCIDLPDS